MMMMMMMMMMIIIALRSEKEQLEKKESNDEDGSIENKTDPIIDTTGATDAMKPTDVDGDTMEELPSVDYATLMKVLTTYSLTI